MTKERPKQNFILRSIEGEEKKIIERSIAVTGFKVIDEAQGIFECYASVFGNIDSYGEVVDKGAFLEWIGTYFPRYPKCVWAHDWSQPIAKTLECREDEHGLYLKGQFVLEVQKAAEVYALMKAGVITDFSFGFSVQEDSWDEMTGTLHLKKIAIYEWSPVLVGANREATLIAVKSGIKEGEAAGGENAPAPVENAPAPVETAKPTEPGGAGGAAETEEAKTARLEKRADALDAALEAVKSLTSTLEALKATESGSSQKEPDTSKVEARSEKGANAMKIVKAILRDARKADKIIESVIVRAKLIK